MKHRVLINCANLHSGGGVAVATSFIDILSQLQFHAYEIHLLLSTSVHRNLRQMNTNYDVFSSCSVVDFFGVSALWKGLGKRLSQFDLVFTVFGPAYVLFPKAKHIVGFAQPNIIYPDSIVYRKSSLLSRLITRLKYKIQEFFFTRADIIIVELEHVKVGLSKISVFRDLPIYIVYSSVHSIYQSPKSWAPLDLAVNSPNLRLGIISRNYPHKNLRILSDVKKRLLEKHNRIVDFYVTFQPDEWVSCDDVFRNHIINVGGLTLSQCPTFYNAMDGVIFPSLLECFSAVPIEAMMMQKPLFASRLPFIRDVCDGNCSYFDPLDASDIARTIHEFFDQPDLLQRDSTDAAYEFVQKYPSPVARAKSYMSIIDKALA